MQRVRYGSTTWVCIVCYLSRCESARAAETNHTVPSHAKFVKGVIGFPFGRVNEMNARRKGLHRLLVGRLCTRNLPDTTSRVTRHGPPRRQVAPTFLCFVSDLRRVTASPRKGAAGSTETEPVVCVSHPKCNPYSRRAERDEGLGHRPIFLLPSF